MRGHPELGGQRPHTCRAEPWYLCRMSLEAWKEHLGSEKRREGLALWVLNSLKLIDSSGRPTRIFCERVPVHIVYRCGDEG